MVPNHEIAQNKKYRFLSVAPDEDDEDDISDEVDDEERDVTFIKKYTPCSLWTELRADKIHYCNKIIY